MIDMQEKLIDLKEYHKSEASANQYTRLHLRINKKPLRASTALIYSTHLCLKDYNVL